MLPMNLRQFTTMLKARRALILCVLVWVLAIAVALNALLPRQYLASTDVVIDIKSPDPVAGVVYPAISSPQYMATQIDIIHSARVARRVITLLHLDTDAATVARWKAATGGQGDIKAWLGAALERHLGIRPSSQGNVVTLIYRSGDPAEAATMANAFAQAYIDTSLELRVDPALQNARWFKGQVDTMRQDLEAAQARLADFQQRNGILDGSGDNSRVDVETAKLDDLNNQLAQARAQEIDSQSKQSIHGQSGLLPEVMSSPLIQTLRQNIAQNQAQLSQMSQTVGTSYPEYKRLQAQTAELQQQLDDQIARVADSIKVASRLDQARVAALQRQIEDQKHKILDLNQRRAQMAVLQREVDTAQKAYDAVAQRFSQTSLESQSTVTNVAVLTPATPPLRPASPAVVRNLVLALLLGLNLGVALALGLELWNRRIRTREDVALLLGLPVLAELGLPARAPARRGGAMA